MKDLKNTLGELLSSHIKIWQSFQNELTRYNQLDFLTYWALKAPWEAGELTEKGQLRDNPNRELTNYPNTYKMVYEDRIQIQYVENGHVPIMIMQWYYEKTPTCEGWKVCVYGKGLRLYCLGKIDWLRDYIDSTAGKVIRADLCRDNKDPIDPSVVDLANTITIGEGDKWTYKGFGQKNSPLFIRIYDKTLDLKKDKFAMAWLYPDWYQKQCRRIEAKLTGRYAQSYTATQWLDLITFDDLLVASNRIERNYIKSALYNLIQSIDYIPNTDLQAQILQGCIDTAKKKLKKLLRFTGLHNNDA